MQSLAYIPGSNGASNASLMTVQQVRTAPATTITVNTVAGAPAKFFASMGTPHTFTDPVTGETITVISEATAVDFAGRIDSGKIEIDQIAPGYTDLGSKVGDIIIIRPITEWANTLVNILAQSLEDDGKLKTTSLDHFFKPVDIADNGIASGGVIAQTVTFTASFSDIVYYIAGLRYSKTGIANKVYAASKDTYVFINTAGAITYTEVANNAATPATPANSLLVARVITNGSTITTVRQYGQGVIGSRNINYGSVGKAQSVRGTTGTAVTTGTVLAFISDYTFKAGVPYLILANFNFALPNGGGSIWSIQARVGGSVIASARRSSRSSEAGIQTGGSINGLYIPNVDTVATVDFRVVRDVGDNTISLEFPDIAVIPLIAGI